MRRMNKSYTFRYEALTPISHGDEGTLSTITPFRRQRVYSEGEYYDIPVVSGNSFRGGALRRKGMKRFCDLLGLKKESLRAKPYYLLFNGGALSKGDSDVSIGAKKEFRRILPLVSIFGGGIDNMLLEGRMQIGFIYPIGKETQVITGIHSDRSVFEFLNTVFYTRRDDYIPEDPTMKEMTVQMKYECEIMIPGTKFVQQVTVTTDEELELSAFGFLMKIFQEEPHIGSKANVGHGFVTFEPSAPLPDSKPFEDYVENNKEMIISYIRNLA